MCFNYITSFSECPHTLSLIETAGCSTKDCVDPPERLEKHEGKCPNCIGPEPFQNRYDGPPVYYKVSQRPSSLFPSAG